MIASVDSSFPRLYFHSHARTFVEKSVYSSVHPDDEWMMTSNLAVPFTVKLIGRILRSFAFHLLTLPNITTASQPFFVT